jgi:hypothetical protein
MMADDFNAEPQPLDFREVLHRIPQLGACERSGQRSRQPRVPRAPHRGAAHRRRDCRGHLLRWGHLKGVGKVYLQTAFDCHSRYAWARLYPNKLTVTALQVLHKAFIDGIRKEKNPQPNAAKKAA